MYAVQTCVCHNRLLHTNKGLDGDKNTGARGRKRLDEWTPRFRGSILASLGVGV
jgi:hypothetical protein